MPKIDCIEIQISNSDGHFNMYFSPNSEVGRIAEQNFILLFSSNFRIRRKMFTVGGKTLG